jgi:CheY-like chemotaxis protein
VTERKQSGGYIWVYSEPGHGATFKIYLPRVEEAPESRRKALPPADSLKGFETVLVVENEEMVRVPICTVLRDYGYRILEAENGEQALKMCEQHRGRIHLVLTDLVMPGMNGQVLWERIAPLDTDTRVLFTSGHTDHTVFDRGILERGAPFLQKLFSPDALARKVRGVLDARYSR